MPEVNLAVALGLLLLALGVAHGLLQRFEADTLSARRRALSAEIKQLKQEAARYNAPSTYSKHAKLLRQAAAKEKELNALDATRAGSTAWTPLVARALVAAQVLVAVAAVVLSWQRPIAAVPPRWLWPANALFAAPHGALGFAGAGLVAAGPFCYACVRASRALVAAVAPAGS